jgi:hypothetical protein
MMMIHQPHLDGTSCGLPGASPDKESDVISCEGGDGEGREESRRRCLHSIRHPEVRYLAREVEALLDV